ncbi:MAG: DNA methyltransferase [Candidatus Parcubacteria bacterium]|nr:DNA methyltransferase [Leptolyngbyaceae cyanobacterium LF-bin-113]
MRAKIFYFTLQDEQTKEEKLDWFERTKFEDIPFDHITPDQKANWINLTNNDFDTFLPLIDKEVKAGRSQQAVFQLFSRGVATQRDEWVYDFSKDALIERMKYFVEVYSDRLENGVKRELDIKWDPDLESYLRREISKKFEDSNIRLSLYRNFGKMYFYFDKHFNGRAYQMFNIFPNLESKNRLIGFMGQSAGKPFSVIATDLIPDLNCISPASGGTQCLPLYRYDKDGSRIDNITDWGLTQFQTHYSDPTITKPDIFHYTYAVLHHPAYRTKYELNLKREFPRLPFYADFHQWATWGKTLMDLHLNYETIQPYGLERQEIATKEKPKAKLKADKTQGVIILDENSQLTGIPAIAWDYKLGNRSALEWILDQYKEKKPKDPTIAKLFNTYKFADYQEQVIDLLDRVCTVSVKTMEIIHQMPAE